MDRKQYIANCISRILRAPCEPKKLNQRAEDLAEIVMIAHRESALVAHLHLVVMLHEAESGKYALKTV